MEQKTDYQKDINSIIEKVLTEKTFNLEIVDEIKKLRELPEKISMLQERNEELIKQANVYSIELDELRGEKKFWKEKEKTLTSKERELELKEVEFKWKDKLLDKYEAMMGMVFRNTSVRENLHKQVPVSDNGYTRMEYVNENREVTPE